MNSRITTLLFVVVFAVAFAACPPLAAVLLLATLALMIVAVALALFAR